MLTLCEQKVMEVVLPQPYKTRSVRGISQLIESSYALTWDSTTALIKKKLVRAEKIGRSLACKVNLSANPKQLAISSLIHSQKFLDRASFGFVIDELKDKLNDLIYIMILFGSYVKGTATKKSDIDLLFVVQNKEDIEKTRKKIKSVLSSTNIRIEFDVIQTEWLVNMFGEKNTVGREVLEASIILHGAEQYYTLVNHYDKTRGH